MNPVTSAIPRLDSDFVSRALGRASDGAPPTVFTGVVTDSRKIRPGCLFVALKGDTFDGHEFVAAAVAQGATGIICRAGTPVPAAARVFSVPDTLEAYRTLGAAWRGAFHLPVIAVAGSVGKTTTKEFLAACLRGRWPLVLKTEASQNGFIGVAMTLLELRPEHGAAVIEIGIDEIGAMAQHLPIAAPTASLVTNIGPEHLEKLKDVATVAREESIALTSVAQSGGLVALNLDDPWLKPLAHKLKGRIVGYTLPGAPNAAPHATPLEQVLVGKLDANGTHVSCNGLGLIDASFELPLPGKHNAGNLVAAIAMACALGLTREEIHAGLKTFKSLHGRSELRPLPGNTPVVCDYYNANPTSTEAGLELLTQVAARGRATPRKRWACLGDMLELGPEEELFHRNLAAKILELKIDQVLLYGPRMRFLYSELQARGFAGGCAHFNTHADLAGHLTAGARPGDAILIKGSRGMKMEEVWKILEPYAQVHWQ